MPLPFSSKPPQPSNRIKAIIGFCVIAGMFLAFFALRIAQAMQGT